MSYPTNLYDYKKYPATKNCYLDGRYFNKVLGNYPRLITNPLKIFWFDTPQGQGAELPTRSREYIVQMADSPVDNKYIGLLRVIIQTPQSRHRNLLIIDYQKGQIFRVEPYGATADDIIINNIIKQYLSTYIQFELFMINTVPLIEKNPNCSHSGFCVAYVTKFAYDYIYSQPFDSDNILSFANKIETFYGPVEEKGRDVEYGLFDDQRTRGAIIGGLGGAVLGGIVGGGSGAIVGGGVGALGGYALSQPGGLFGQK